MEQQGLVDWSRHVTPAAILYNLLVENHGMAMSCIDPDVGKIVSFQAANVDEESDCGQHRSAVCHRRSVTASAIWVLVAKRVAPYAASVPFRVPASSLQPPLDGSRTLQGHLLPTLPALHQVPKPA